MNAPVVQVPAAATVPLASVRRDPKLSCRARGTDERTVAEYAAAMQAGAAFPPVVVFRDKFKTHWLADGFHRTAAAELAGLTEIVADVREGSRDEAARYAVSANVANGLRRTNADKRRAVELALALKAFAKMSDREIGDACGVDHKTVAAARRARGEIPQSTAPRARPFDADRELSRLETTVAALLDRWPSEDEEGRQRLRRALAGWGERAQATKRRGPRGTRLPVIREGRPATGKAVQRSKANGAAKAAGTES